MVLTRRSVRKSCSARAEGGRMVWSSGRKIERFSKSNLAGARCGALFLGGRDNTRVDQKAKYRAADPNLVAWHQLLLTDRRPGDEGSVAAVEILQCAGVARSDEKAMPSRNRVVFELQIVGVLSANTIFALR